MRADSQPSAARQSNELAGTVSELLADPERAAAMGEAGRRWVSEHWQWDGIARRLETLLRPD